MQILYNEVTGKMNLIIDIGNTGIKLAVFNAVNQMVFWQRTNPDNCIEVLEEISGKFSINHAIISQVGQPVEGLEKYLSAQKIYFIKLHTGLKLPFNIAYKTPETIGADRLGLVAGAILKQPEGNKLIIDAGTCVTYDFVDKNKLYHGGAISPGLGLRFKSLNDYTANLPLLQAGEKDIPLIGYDTNSSIKSGVIHGLVNEIEGYIVKYNLKFKDFTVFLTGGDEKVLDRYIKNKIFVGSKFLLLEGLNFILNLNK